MFRKFRIAVLLLVLLFVGLNTYFDRVYSTDWDIPLRIGVYPINADGSKAAARYIAALEAKNFRPIEEFFAAEGQRHGIAMERPVRFYLGQPVTELPPKLAQRAALPSVMMWSLRTRYWAWRAAEDLPGAPPDVQLFVMYHDPAQHPVLPHSVGLQKGLFGIVNAFAEPRADGMNLTVCAHELLHTLGASDKYHLADNQPQHPQGFAEPDRQPLYPQRFAELMGGRIPLSATESEIPRSLDEVLIGPLTAAEIGWKRR
jgi:hypothetical protein